MANAKSPVAFCETCGKSFMSKRNLRRHHQNIHEKDVWEKEKNPEKIVWNPENFKSVKVEPVESGAEQPVFNINVFFRPLTSEIVTYISTPLSPNHSLHGTA